MSISSQAQLHPGRHNLLHYYNCHPQTEVHLIVAEKHMFEYKLLQKNLLELIKVFDTITKIKSKEV